MMDSTVNLMSSQPSVGMALAAKAEPPDKLSAAAKVGEERKSPETSSSVLELGKNIDTNTLEKLQKEFNQFLSEKSQTEFKLAIDPDTKKSVFSLVDKNTKEVIQQFPPEEVLAFAKHVIELLDEQAEVSEGTSTVATMEPSQGKSGEKSLSISV